MSEEFDELLEYAAGWRRALTLFLDSHFPYDHILSHAWLYEAFGLEKPGPKTSNDEAEKAKLGFLQNFKPFREVLLKEHQIRLRSEWGVGYRVVHPRNQHKLALEDAMELRKKIMRDMLDQIVHTNVSVLTADERREYADTQARAAMIAMLDKQQRSFPQFPTGETEE